MLLNVSNPEDKIVLIAEEEENGEEENVSISVCKIEKSNKEVIVGVVSHGAENFQDYYSAEPKVTFQSCSDPINENEGTPAKNSFCCGIRTKFRRWKRSLRNFKRDFMFHRRLLLCSLFVSIGSSGCLILFPLHLENVSSGGGDTGLLGIGDGYSACLSASTMTMLASLVYSLVLKVLEVKRKYLSPKTIFFKPTPDLWKNGLKIAFCLGLGVVVIFYSWEDDKVPCNLQDPLLGLVIIFAIITHAVFKWKNIGLKRTFALSAIAAGVFLSVNYPLMDHHRCRGYYYRRNTNSPINEIDDGGLWTWKVHLVWTFAFVVSIWLATLAAFFLESSVPLPKTKHSRLYDLEYNAVKLREINSLENDQNANEESTSPSSYRFNPYTNFGIGTIANSVLFFTISTWTVVILLFWTEFIPGFGKGIDIEKLGDRILASFRISFASGSSWGLFLCLFIFSHSFTYLTVLTRSPITAVCVSTIGFPIIGLWWSFFQIQTSLFIWMPVWSGELICAAIGLITVTIGCFYFIRYEILKPAKIKVIRHSLHY